MLFDFPLIIRSMPRLLEGLVLTIELVGAALALGLCLAIPLAILRTARNKWLSWPVYAYTYFFRGTPLLIQLFLIYYGIAQFAWIKHTFLWSIYRDAFACALTAFTLNTAAYTTEILRGALEAVPAGEIEAARALGMPRRMILMRITLPQAFRLMLPAYSNEVIFTMQASSIASIVTLMDLTGWARVLIAQSFAPFEIFITIGIIYMGLTYGIAWVFRKWEWRLSGHLRDRPQTRMVA